MTIKKYPKEFKGIKEYNALLLKEWIKLLESMPYIYHDIDMEFIGTHNVISGCFPVDHEEMDEEYVIYSGIFDFKTGGLASIDFDGENVFQGTWKDVYKKLVDSITKLTKTILPEIS